MSGVLTYLDCGCAIRKSGGRSWCPTCADGSPRKPASKEAAARLEELEDTLRFVRTLIEGYVDIEDGDETSGPRPNEAMRATSLINDTIGEA